MSTPKKPPLPRIPSVQSMPAIDVRYRAGSSLVPGPSISLPPPAPSIPPPGEALPIITGLPAEAPAPAPSVIVVGPTPSASALPAVVRPAPRAPNVAKRLALIAVICGAVAALVITQVVGRSGRTSTQGSSSAPGQFVERFDVQHFQRGNVHTHSTRSDGLQPPEEVAAWYRDSGYQFLVLSEHDVFIDPEDLARMEAPGFVMIPGEEISSTGSDRPVHVLALCTHEVIASGTFDTTRNALVDAVTGVRAHAGSPVVNHPNFKWALGTSDVAAVPGEYALEIWSGHPDVNTMGDALHQSHEALWDELLTRGRRVTGVAVDDAHTLVPKNEMSALPGRGWIATFGDATTRESICAAIAAGRYYASSGVRLSRIVVSGGALAVWVEDPSAVVEFVGTGGDVLATVKPSPSGEAYMAEYGLRGGESYVRARVAAKGGGKAWTQAYRTSR